MTFFEEVRAALAERRVELDCESCGERSWKIGAGELGNLWVQMPLVTEHGESIDVPPSLIELGDSVEVIPGQRGGLSMCPMICTKCGYTRLYTLQVLLGDDWRGFREGGT
jgi:hypothetical protein